MKRRTLTELEFNQLKPVLLQKSIASHRIDAAYRVLVLYETLESVSNSYNCIKINGKSNYTRFSIRAMVDSVWKEHLKIQKNSSRSNICIPKDWERVVLIAPKSLVLEFREQIEQYKQKGG